MEKVISLAIKMHKSRFNNKPLDNIYSFFTSDSFGKQITSNFDKRTIIELIFLIYFIDKGKEPKTALKFIKNNMFCFNTMDVENDYKEINCNYCNGEGTVNCSECDGTGEVDCPSCDGTGDIDDEQCDNCYHGIITCEECNGNGYESCDNCDGLGYVISDSEAHAMVYEFVSVDRKLFDEIELLNENDKFDYEKINNNLTIILSEHGKDVDLSFYDNEYEILGETLFISSTKNPKFYTYSNGRIFVGNLD